jgi:transcriptional regulator with XRE-family HTH domain
MNQLPDRWHDLGEFIREQRASARLSLRKLSELAGISNPYLSQIERGLRKPSAEILQQIAKALRISAETLYVRAGILEERDDDGDLESEILRDRYLTEDQKQMLIQVYRAFRNEALSERERSGREVKGENEGRAVTPPVAAARAEEPEGEEQAAG